MKKIALSFISIISLLSPVLFILPTVEACVSREPSTLLNLYQNSGVIHVARFTGQEDGKTTKEEDDDYSTTEVRKHFDVVTTLKGATAKTVTLFSERTTHIPEPVTLDEIPEPPSTEPEETEVVAEEVSSEDYAAEEESTELKPGDDVLLFLQADEENGRMEQTDYEGLKKLSRADMAVYEARIKELAPILAVKDPNFEKLTDWLVACAAEPATRWEGTYELHRSFQNLDWRRELAEKNKAKAAAGEVIEENEEESREVEWSSYQNRYKYAEAMNEFHRQTLTNILLNAEFRVPNKKELVSGDNELMSLVARWADTRIAMLFLNQLRSGAYSARENSQLMDSVASILKDSELENLSEKFGNFYYRSDDTEADDDDLIDIEEDAEEAVEDSPIEETEPVVMEPAASSDKASEEDETSEAVAAKPAKMNYKQLREIMIAKFVQRADLIILNPEVGVAAAK